MTPEQFEQPTTPERISDDVLISDVPVIEQGGVPALTREDLSKVVEAPLLDACEELYDKNIKTWMSSANKKDIEYRGQAYIQIDFDSLSEENKEIALQLGETFMMHGSKPTKCVNITFPVGESTTVGDIRRMAHEAVSQFRPQPMTWAETVTLEELRKSLMDPTLTPADFPYYFYDEASGLFYQSQEHFDKVRGSRKDISSEN